MDQRRIGGGRTTRKPRIRPLSMSRKRWKTMLRKRVGRRGTRSLRPQVSFGTAKSKYNTNLMKGISNIFRTKENRSKYSYRALKSMSRNFKRSLKAVSKVEKSKLKKIAEEQNIDLESLENHIDTVVEDKLNELRKLTIAPGAHPDAIKLVNKLHEIANIGLDYGTEASNPDYTVAQQQKYRKKFREALKKAYIKQKTYEGGGDEGFGKEQGTIAYHEFMQKAIMDEIHKERPNIGVNALANIFKGAVGL